MHKAIVEITAEPHPYGPKYHPVTYQLIAHGNKTEGLTSQYNVRCDFIHIFSRPGQAGRDSFGCVSGASDICEKDWSRRTRKKEASLYAN